MSDPTPRTPPALGGTPIADLRGLLPYVAALELEVDRLRRHNRLVHQETLGALTRIREICGAAAPNALAELARLAEGLAAVLRDLQEPLGYHPAHDQVVPIAVRPLAEQVFRWQQHLHAATTATLRLELESDYVEWFPARLRHILDNLFSNALRYRDPAKAGSWVRLQLRLLPGGFEFRVSDNGIGMREGDCDQVLELFYRAIPGRGVGLGVGLAVVKLLVEQSGGSLAVDSGEGQGTTVVVVLPRYETEDYL